MIETYADLGLEKAENVEGVERLVQEKLGIAVSDMRKALSSYVLAAAEALTHEFVNMAPLGDYSKLLEDNDSMADFLKTEAHKEEHWKLESVGPSDVNKSLISFAFINDAIDDGDVFKGFVYVSYQGKIKHAFAQGE